MLEQGCQNQAWVALRWKHFGRDFIFQNPMVLHINSQIALFTIDAKMMLPVTFNKKSTFC